MYVGFVFAVWRYIIYNCIVAQDGGACGRSDLSLSGQCGVLFIYNSLSRSSRLSASEYKYSRPAALGMKILMSTFKCRIYVYLGLGNVLLLCTLCFTVGEYRFLCMS